MGILGTIFGLLLSLTIHKMHWITGATLGFLIGYALEMRFKIQNLETLVKELRNNRDSKSEESKAQDSIRPTEIKVHTPQVEEIKAPPKDLLAELQEKSKTHVRANTYEQTSKNQHSKTEEFYERLEESKPNDKPPSTLSVIFGFFRGDKGLVRIGALILLIGISFLMKTIVPVFTITPTMKCIAIALGGFALIAFGYWIKEKKETYALSLIGIGLSVLFLDAYGAYFFFEIIGYQVALLLTIVIGAFGLYTSLKHDSLPLAVLALGGGFIAPILSGVATNIPDTIVFGYYVILNLIILATGYYKSWRLLNILGFASTFLLFPQWYAPNNIALMQVMLLTFFLIYLAITILYAQKEVINEDGYVDNLITFALPFAILGFEYETLRNVEYGYAYVTGALAIIYAFTAIAVSSREQFNSIRISFIALSSALATLTIPLVFDQKETSALWAIEGVAALWLGMKQRSELTRFTGIILQGIAGVLVAQEFFDGFLRTAHNTETLAILNVNFFNFVILAITGFITAYLYRKKSTVHTPYDLYALLWSFFWLFGAVTREIEIHTSNDFYQINAFILAISVLTIALQFMSNKMDWRALSLPSLVYTPVLAACGLSLLDEYQVHPLEGIGLPIWLLAFTSHLAILKMRKDEGLEVTCALGLLGFLTLLAFEYGLFISHHTNLGFSWTISIWITFFAGSLWIIHRHGLNRVWPFTTYAKAYQNYALPIISYIIAILIFVATARSGSDFAGYYLPLLNPIEVASLFGIYVLFSRLKSPTKLLRTYAPALRSLVGLLAFAVINTPLARAVHMYTDTPYKFGTLMHNSYFLAGTSILWAIIALSMILKGSRKNQRKLWITGATLIAIVIFKLFFVDMSKVDMLAKTISFIAVGLLLIGVGYFSPIPATKKD